MSWTQENIRFLRLRFGWSQSDLARRMVCKAEQIMAWEEGALVPELHHKRLLDILDAHAQSTADEIRATTVAEQTLETTHHSQVNRNTLKEV